MRRAGSAGARCSASAAAGREDRTDATAARASAPAGAAGRLRASRNRRSRSPGQARAIDDRQRPRRSRATPARATSPQSRKRCGATPTRTAAATSLPSERCCRRSARSSCAPREGLLELSQLRRRGRRPAYRGRPRHRDRERPGDPIVRHQERRGRRTHRGDYLPPEEDRWDHG